MSYNAIVLADSVSPAGHRVVSIEATFPRFLLAEVNTHRDKSRNSASSRAIPVKDRIAQIADAPFIPESFGKNRSGMQASEELDKQNSRSAHLAWLVARDAAVSAANRLEKIEVHKQIANRVLEPFAWHTAIITATEWANWDALRVSKMAQPEMYKIAGMMREVRLASAPLVTSYDRWHLPYVRGLTPETYLEEEFKMIEMGIDPVKVCVGRCAAISFNRQSSQSDMQKDAARCDKLSKDGHMSPLEHALRPMDPTELELFGRPEIIWDTQYSRFITNHHRKRYFLGNVEGWVQYRKMIPGEDVYSGQ